MDRLKRLTTIVRIYTIIPNIFQFFDEFIPVEYDEKINHSFLCGGGLASTVNGS